MAVSGVQCLELAYSPYFEICFMILEDLLRFCGREGLGAVGWFGGLNSDGAWGQANALRFLKRPTGLHLVAATTRLIRSFLILMI